MLRTQTPRHLFSYDAIPSVYTFFFCQLNVSILTEALIPDSKQQLKQLEKFRRGFEITIKGLSS